MKNLWCLTAAVVFGFGSLAAGAVSLSIDGQVGDEVILKVGQTAVVWVSSDDGVPYSAYVGFEGGTAVPGTLDSPLVYTAAGNLASVSAVSPPPIAGYYVNAAGASPAPSAGVHFRLIFTAASEGKATLKLYDSTLSAVLQSVTITVEGAQAGTGFTYQGRLLDEDKAASGLFDLRFEMFETPSGGSGIGGRVDLADVSVEDGYFTVRLDFGNVFGGQARWLQTSVRPGGSEDEYTQLWPRQRLTAAPQATYAAAAGLAEHAVIASGVHWANVAGIPPAIANYAAPNVQTGFVPYYDGSRFVSSAIRSDSGRVAVGTNISTERNLNIYTDSDLFGLYCANARSSGSNFGIYGEASGNTTSSNFGVYGRSSSNAGYNYALYGLANSASTGTNYGVYGSASNSGTGSAYAGWFAGDVRITGILNQDSDLRIARDAGTRVAIGAVVDPSMKVRVYASSETYGVYSVNAREGGSLNVGSYGAASGNTTGVSYGVYGRSSSNSGSNLAIYGVASAASTGTNYGVYGYAVNSGTGAAYAGYFSGTTILTGDVGVGTTSIPTGRRINTSTGAYLSTGGTWVNASSRERKENFEAVDGREVLEALVRVPVSTWNYKEEDASVRHMGPVSQDLYAAFKLSGDDESISTVDTAGLSFAAIQGLYEMVAEKEGEIASVKEENERLRFANEQVRRENEQIRDRLSAIEARLAALAGQ